jgi:uncharacterized protein YjgD (DUF1641 family)
MDQKLDTILHYVNEQRIKREMTEDLLADASIVGKDIWEQLVEDLDKADVEINPEDIRFIVFKLLKNIKNFHEIIALFESAFDFLKDAGPIVNEIIILITKRLHKTEQKGYFEMLEMLPEIADEVIDNFRPDDLKRLKQNIPMIIKALKQFSQPEVLQFLIHSTESISQTAKDAPDPMSIWKLSRELGKPETKKAIGFGMKFLKNMADENKSN